MLDLKGQFFLNCGCCNRNKDYTLICDPSPEFGPGKKVSHFWLQIQGGKPMGILSHLGYKPKTIGKRGVLE